MEHWDLSSLAVQPHRPQVINSEGEGRTILLQLPAGERLQEHRVHERTWLVVIDGEIELEADGEVVRGGPGLAAVFNPKESHEVRARSHARLLLVLAPWPGDGHPGSAG